MTAAERESFFRTWAKERAAADAVHSIYVVITREPPHLEIEVRHGPREFASEDLQKLKTMLIRAFRAMKYDDGLLEAVKFVDEKVTR